MRTDRRQWLLAGSLMSGASGVSFVLFKMTMAALLGAGFFTPLRNIGAMALGERALASTYPLERVAIAGFLVHMALSVLYGACFAGLAGSVAFVRGSRAALLAGGVAMGLFLWVVNLYVFVPLFFPWFTHNVPVIEILARTLFFGVPLSALLAARLLPRGGEAAPQGERYAFSGGN